MWISSPQWVTKLPASYAGRPWTEINGDRLEIGGGRQGDLCRLLAADDHAALLAVGAVFLIGLDDHAVAPGLDRHLLVVETVPHQVVVAGGSCGAREIRQSPLVATNERIEAGEF